MTYIYPKGAARLLTRVSLAATAAGETSLSKPRPRSIGLLAAMSLAATPIIAQQPVASITVSGAVTQSLTLTAADLAAMPRAKATTSSNGITTVYEGVSVADVLKKAGAPLGAGMRGNALSTYVLASASDGYQVVFSLGELDPDITDGEFLLADTANGKPMFGETGAFRLLVPKDKRGARSVRMLTSLTVVQLKK